MFSWYHIPFLQGTQSVCNYSFNCAALSWKPPSYWTLSGGPGCFLPSVLFTGSSGSGNLGEWLADWCTYRPASPHPLHAFHLGNRAPGADRGWDILKEKNISVLFTGWRQKTTSALISKELGCLFCFEIICWENWVALTLRGSDYLLINFVD